MVIKETLLFIEFLLKKQTHYININIFCDQNMDIQAFHINFFGYLNVDIQAFYHFLIFFINFLFSLSTPETKT